MARHRFAIKISTEVTKRKQVGLWVGLIILTLLVVLSSFAGSKPVSASPERLKWSIIATPSEKNKVVISPSEISAFVIGSDGDTFYAVDIPNKKVYKSTDGSLTWEDHLTVNLEKEGAMLPVWDIAVAPADPKLVAAVTDNRTKVYLSGDGGDNWLDARTPNLADLLISDIAISPEYDDTWDIAIGTRNPDGSKNGDVWVIKLGGLAGWNAIGLNMDVSSVRFSPDYFSDKTIVAITSDTNSTYLCTRYRDPIGAWRDWISPVEINGSPREDEIISSDLALPLDYSGDQEGSRVAYLAYNSNGLAGDDAYRIEDTGVYRLNVKSGQNVSLASIAYYGTRSSGKLLAGEVLAKVNSASASIHICSNPREIFPNWEEPTSPPSGGAVSGSANAQLAWSAAGGTAYCGTSSNYVQSAADWATMTLPGGPWRGQGRDESAFSVSQNNGNTWDQLSLIDTQMSQLSDFAFSSDDKTLYLASAGGEFDSLWRSQSETLGERWQRILCLRHKGDIILRHTPKGSSKEAIFFAILGAHDIYYSFDEGQYWKRIPGPPEISDLAVVNSEKFYVLDDDNLLHPCTGSLEGFWELQDATDTGLRSAYAIVLSGAKSVFVAEDENGEGRIAYSTDGGGTFQLSEPLSESGNVQLVPDEEFDQNGLIYAASDSYASSIYRWTIKGSTSWKKLNSPHPGFHALAQKGGALYGAYASRGGVARTLIPRVATITGSDWDNLELGLASGVVFKPGTLKTTVNEKVINLWAIDQSDYDFSDDKGCLWVYSDTFVLQTPWPTSPAIAGFIPCDPCNCRAQTFCFSWQELPSAEEYELWISLDEKFASVIYQQDKIAPADVRRPSWCPPSDLPHFSCGETYYWKVRASEGMEEEAIHSRWSPPMYFTVKAGTSAITMHITPILEVPDEGSRDVSPSPSFSWIGFPETTKYEFILARDAQLTQIIVKEELATSAYHYSGKLDWGTSYFWQVRASKPVPSEPAIATFTVMPQLPTAAPPPPAPATPIWVWLVIGVLALLIVVIIAFSLRRR